MNRCKRYVYTDLYQELWEIFYFCNSKYDTRLCYSYFWETNSFYNQVIKENIYKSKKECDDLEERLKKN